MTVIIRVITRSVNSIIYLALLLILFIYIYTLLGFQIYNKKLDTNETLNFFNDFDNFHHVFITVFQIMTLEGWNNVFFICLKSINVNKLITYLYFISWICIGNYVLLNLFLAILLDGFTNEKSLLELKENNGAMVKNYIIKKVKKIKN